MVGSGPEGNGCSEDERGRWAGGAKPRAPGACVIFAAARL